MGISTRACFCHTHWLKMHQKFQNVPANFQNRPMPICPCLQTLVMPNTNCIWYNFYYKEMMMHRIWRMLLIKFRSFSILFLFLFSSNQFFMEWWILKLWMKQQQRDFSYKLLRERHFLLDFSHDFLQTKL